MKNIFFTRKYFSEKVLKPVIFMETNPHLVIPVSVEFLVTFAPNIMLSGSQKILIFQIFSNLYVFTFFELLRKVHFFT